MFWPVIQPASGVVRNATTAATSSGWPEPAERAQRGRLGQPFLGVVRAQQAVSVAPGETVLTVIPRGPSSRAATAVTCSSAALLAQ